MKRKPNKENNKQKTKVKVELFEAAQNKIQYIKELKELDGIKSVNACLLMAQIEYWFSISGNGFYKYKARPETEQYRYKDGDSWTEELGISNAEFTSAFAQIGISYNSKKLYDEAKVKGDVFKGKFYCSYNNKVNRLTHYFRNDKKVNEAIQFLRELKTQTPGNKDSQLSDSTKLVSRDEENGIMEQDNSSLESTDTTSNTTTETISDREQASLGNSISKNKEVFNVSEDNIESQISQDEEIQLEGKIILPDNFTPTWDAKYRAMLHFPENSPAWVTEKFVEHYKANCNKATIRQWHQKWWDWMSNERTKGEDESLAKEHNEILNYVARDVNSATEHFDFLLFDLADFLTWFEDDYSEETIIDVLEELYLNDFLGRVGEYYFDNKKAQSSNEALNCLFSGIASMKLEDEIIDIYSWTNRKYSLRQYRAHWAKKKKE